MKSKFGGPLRRSSALCITALFYLISASQIFCKEKKLVKDPPEDNFKRQEWIFENYNSLHKHLDDLLKLPKDVPAGAHRPLSRAAVETVKSGMSFKMILATLGAPDNVAKVGGSGPLTMPSIIWCYDLPESGEVLRIEIMLGDNLLDATVSHYHIIKKEEK